MASADGSLAIREEFPGDHSGEATPVPIPNTAVKLLAPMVLAAAERVGVCPVFDLGPPQSSAAVFFCPRGALTQKSKSLIIPKVKGREEEVKRRGFDP